MALVRAVRTFIGMTTVDAVGWASSGILLATITKQVHRQWMAGTSEGVSKWLFLGQIAASIGFTIYSVLVSNPIFIVTNALMLVAAFVGLALLFHHRHRERRRAMPPAAPRARPSAKGRAGAQRRAVWRAATPKAGVPRGLWR